MSATRKLDRPDPVLVLHFETGRIEFYALNPGDVFERFGGSRHPLVARKTASLITRETFGGTVSDTEHDIDAVAPWRTIAKAIEGAIKARAETPRDTGG